MKRSVRRFSRFGYQKVAKPLMFRHDPDTVHAGLTKTAKKVQKLPAVRSLPKLWAHTNKLLETEVMGITFRNPVGLSAGFDTTIELPPLMQSIGFGWMTGGSVTWGEYEGNERPWFHRLPKSKSLVVNKGLASEGAPVVATRVSGYQAKLFQNFPLSVSIAKTNSRECASDEEAIEDYCHSLAIFDTLQQVQLLEVNISCPNTFGGEPFTTPKRLEKLMAAIDVLELTKPVVVKMPISLSWHDFDALLRVIIKHKVAGVAVGNLLKDRSKAVLHDALPDSIKGNLSGKPNKELSTELIRKTYQKFGDKLFIIGIGGVMSAEDAYDKIKAGASLIALITGLIYEGPQLIGEMNYGLVKLLKRDGYQHISEAVGKGV